jgi:hypothetical protein
MSQEDQWNGGHCNTCNRPISSDGGWAAGQECAFPNGVSCRAYAEQKLTKEKKDPIVVNPNHDNHPLAQAFTKSLRAWLDTGATLSSVLQTLEEECWARKERILAGDTAVKGAADDWGKAAEEFCEFNEPEGLA